MLKALPLKGVRGLTWCWQCGDGRWMTVNSMTNRHIGNIIRIKQGYNEPDYRGSELGFFLELARARGIRIPTSQPVQEK
jgi:hypothetical protein